MPKNYDVKSWLGFELYIRCHESDQTSKRFNSDINGSIAISGTKRFVALALSKDKRKAKGRAILTVIQQLFNKLLNSRLTR